MPDLTHRRRFARPDRNAHPKGDHRAVRTLLARLSTCSARTAAFRLGSSAPAAPAGPGPAVPAAPGPAAGTVPAAVTVPASAP